LLPQSAPVETHVPRTRRALAAYYFLWLGAIGLFLPYYGLHLRRVGYSDAEATRLLGLGPAMGLLAPPIAGLLADVRRARPHLLRGASLLMVIAFLGLLPDAPPALVTVVAMAAFSLARAPIGTLVDAASTEAAGRERFGRMRLWGSSGFLLTVLAGGALAERVGGLAMRVCTLAILIGAAGVSFAVPAPKVSRRRGVLAAWWAVVRTPAFLLFLLAMLLSEAAAATYDGAFSLHLARLGYPHAFIGLAWAIGVASEVGVLWLSPMLFRRFPPGRLFALSIAVAAARWAALATVVSPAAILALAPLHGITFGLWYASAVQVVQVHGRAVPTGAQGLLAAAYSMGAVLGVGLSGDLLERGGGRLLFGAAAGAAALGVLLAAAAGEPRERTVPLERAA
jgi:PPP family 3-phenylpropionic acid transporter